MAYKTDGWTHNQTNGCHKYQTAIDSRWKTFANVSIKV